MEPPYDQDTEHDEWLDDFRKIVLAGFASVIVILLLMIVLNGCSADGVTDLPTTPTLAPIFRYPTTTSITPPDR